MGESLNKKNFIGEDGRGSAKTISGRRTNYLVKESSRKKHHKVRNLMRGKTWVRG